jgi:phosphomevalonate kinase
MLAGEYAVLVGAPAVCAAVERASGPRRAAAWLGAEGEATPLARCVARAAAERRGVPPAGAVARALARALAADTAAFRAAGGGPKLGLGSSSAAAAAMAASALAALGRGASPEQGEVLEVALAAHHAFARGGSGADVAACVLGGVVLFRRGARGPRLAPLALPPGLDVRLYFSGAPASTRGLVARVLARAGEPGARRALDALGRAARRFATACRSGDVPALLAAVRAHAAGLAALERAAGVHILTPPHARLVAAAEAIGGAAKPSGAGGGDVAVAFAPDRRTGAAIARAAAREGLLAVPVRIGAPGTRLEPARARRGRPGGTRTR